MSADENDARRIANIRAVVAAGIRSNYWVYGMDIDLAVEEIMDDLEGEGHIRSRHDQRWTELYGGRWVLDS